MGWARSDMVGTRHLPALLAGGDVVECGDPACSAGAAPHDASRAAAGSQLIRGGERERPAGDPAFSGAFFPSWQR